MSKKLIAGIAAVLLTISSPALAEKLKVALLLPGVVTDNSVNQNALEGLKRAQADFDLDIAFTEKVSQAAQSEIFSDYARRGYKVLLGLGGEYGDAAKRAAAQFPDATFVVLNGSPTEGLVTVNYDGKQFGYVLGLVAGSMSKTKKIALLAGHQLAAIDQTIEGYRLGQKKVSPEGEVLVVYTNDWADVAKAKEASFNVISQGADVLLPYLDAAYLGVLQAAKEKDAHVVTIISDTLKDFPEQTYTSTTLDFGGAMHEILKLAAENKLEKRDYLMGIGTEAGDLVGFNDEVPAEIKEMAEKAVADFMAGTLTLN
jgi:basic membrane protein A